GALQHRPDGGVRRRGAVAGGGGPLRTGGLLGRPAAARDRRPGGAGRAGAGRAEAGGGPGHEAGPAGGGRGAGGGGGGDPADEEAALRGEPDRSAHLRGDRALAGGGGAPGQLPAGAP